jgi:hypothetical protein
MNKLYITRRGLLMSASIILATSTTEASVFKPLSRFFFNSNNGISPKKINTIINKYGSNVLIGVDPGENDTPSDVAKISLDYLKLNNIPTYIYLVGPGMMKWSQQERNQIKRYAKSVGINVSNDNWHSEWIKWGWKQKVLQQFNYYSTNYNAYSCEIDNLDSVINPDKDPDKIIKYFLELKYNLLKQNIKTKLHLKNLSNKQLIKVLESSEKLSFDFLCEYATFEKGTGDARLQLKLCKQIGIQAITPFNGLNSTYNYGVNDDGIPYLV